MRNRLILSLALFFCTLGLFAQDFEIVSVESLPADMSAREEMKTDHNDRQCALLRVATQNIAPNQREGFSFVPDLGSEVVERATRDGEIWLWVSPGIKYLRIKHRDWGQYELRLQDYVTLVEALHTYKVTIKGALSMAIQEPNNASPTQQYLVFQLSPTNAVLEVDGQLWEVAPDGTAMKFVNFGTYSYRVQAPNYLPQTGKVTVDDPVNTKIESVKLKSDLVQVTFQVDADAEIWINNEKKGTRTWTGNLGKGTYKIECKQANHETTTVSQEISASTDGKTITLPAPIPIYGSLSIESTPNFAKVYLDGNEIGETPKYISEILVGQHEIRVSKEGYADFCESYMIAKGERKQLKAFLNEVDYEIIANKGDEYFDAGNYEEALKCYREAAEHSDAVGQNGMGRLYNGGYAVKQDYNEAVKWYCLAAEQGLDRAQYNLGRLYYFGDGVVHSYSEAVKWCRKAADQGYAQAQYNLGVMYFEGKGVTQNYSEAIKWYRKAADQGLANAQTNLGSMYANGVGVAQDYSEAMKWYRKAADQEDAQSECYLGYMYTMGYGVAQNYSEAIKWLRKAADQGLAEAQLGLGYMYAMGEGVSQNYSEAAKWFRKAAEQGLDEAQYNMGACYEEGLGVHKDRTEAKKWYRKAADQGFENAKSKLREF